MEINNSVTVKSTNTAGNVASPKAVSKNVSSKANNSDNTNAVNLKEINNIVNGNHGGETYLSVSDKAIASAIEHINKVISRSNIELEYVVHRPTNTVVIKMRDKNTNEVIKEIPPEKVLDMFAQRMKILGLYVDNRG